MSVEINRYLVEVTPNRLNRTIVIDSLCCHRDALRVAHDTCRANHFNKYKTAASTYSIKKEVDGELVIIHAGAYLNGKWRTNK